MELKAAIATAIARAKMSPLFEICGYIICRSGGDYQFYECQNIAADRSDGFEIDMLDTDAARSMGEIVYVVHSHPDAYHLPHLSAFDRIAQYDNRDGDWLLIKPNWTAEAFAPIPKFRGRDYVVGVTDCYSIMQDYYAMCGVRMDNYKRDSDWWDEGQNLYLDNIEREGFRRVELADLQPGDTMLFNYASSVPNHCGIYLGDNEFIHHITNRKSKIDIIDKFWIKFCNSIWRNSTTPPAIHQMVIDRIKSETLTNG